VTVVVAGAAAGVGAESMSVTRQDNPNGKPVNSGTVPPKAAAPSRPATVQTSDSGNVVDRWVSEIPIRMLVAHVAWLARTSS
jgi:hypothetical protein